MAMDSSIYSSPENVVQKEVQRFVLDGIFFLNPWNVIFSSVGDPRFGDLWPEFEAVYHFKLYVYE